MPVRPAISCCWERALCGHVSTAPSVCFGPWWADARTAPTHAFAPGLSAAPLVLLPGCDCGLAARLRRGSPALQPFVGAAAGVRACLAETNLLATPETRVSTVRTGVLLAQAGFRFQLAPNAHLHVEAEAGQSAPMGGP